jgi:phosphinothricin acetyltransferase
MGYTTRTADSNDIPSITKIYNQGIEDRIATLETRLRTVDDMNDWFLSRSEKHKAVVIADEAGIVYGWASLNVFNSRCCYSGVADISIYIDREMRGKGLGGMLLDYLMRSAREQEFHKLVLSTFDFNERGRRLYTSRGFREVGTYMDQGILDDKFVNVTIMEKLLIS